MCRYQTHYTSLYWIKYLRMLKVGVQNQVLLGIVCYFTYLHNICTYFLWSKSIFKPLLDKNIRILKRLSILIIRKCQYEIFTWFDNSQKRGGPSLNVNILGKLNWAKALELESTSVSLLTNRQNEIADVDNFRQSIAPILAYLQAAVLSVYSAKFVPN